jgi:hypothetical protein
MSKADLNALGISPKVALLRKKTAKLVAATRKSQVDVSNSASGLNKSSLVSQPR